MLKFVAILKLIGFKKLKQLAFWIWHPGLRQVLKHAASALAAGSGGGKKKKLLRSKTRAGTGAIINQKL
jgi:hypothetical protein